jgi:gamma-glutamylcyclotransferase (GGCT)/AIG2-like uncharacterized protein YtfP
LLSLSDLLRDGALDELLAGVNRSVEAVGEARPRGRTDSLRRVLGRLEILLGPAPAGAGRSARDRHGHAPVEEEAAVLLARVHAALGRPDRKLAAYGTLVPGGVNHGRVAALRGTWQRCFVRGRRWTAADGDPAFRWNPAGPECAAMLLVSDLLPSAWPDLDRFEGSPYRRRLVPVRVPLDGEDAHHVAYVYESIEHPVSD